MFNQTPEFGAHNPPIPSGCTRAAIHVNCAVEWYQLAAVGGGVMWHGLDGFGRMVHEDSDANQSEMRAAIESLTGASC